VSRPATGWFLDRPNFKTIWKEGFTKGRDKGEACILSEVKA